MSSRFFRAQSAGHESSQNFTSRGHTRLGSSNRATKAASTLHTPPNNRGFTLIELLILVSIVGILASFGIPKVLGLIEQAQYARATTDLDTYFKAVMKHKTSKERYPSTWQEIGYSSPPTDPWGNEYVLNNHNDIAPGNRRSDGPTVPINSQIDIFSPGPDGSWQPNIWADGSKDDVILAGDGSYVGKAENL